MEILFIVIIFVIIAIGSAASAVRKKPSGSGEQGQPPRRTMSDIQRAFMMMSGMENDEEQEQPRFTPPAAPPQPRNVPPVQPRAAYSPPVAYGEGSSNYGDSSGEGASDYGTVRSGSISGDTPIEREAGRKSNYGTVQSGSLRGETPIEREAGRNSSYGTAPSGSIRGNTLINQELKSSADFRLKESDSGDIMQHRLDESVELADIEETNRGIASAQRRRTQPVIKLFENKNEYLKAVIYSEILSRRTLGR